MVTGFISIWEPDVLSTIFLLAPHKLRHGAGSRLLSISKQHYSALSLKCLVANERPLISITQMVLWLIQSYDDGLDSYHLMTFSHVSILVKSHPILVDWLGYMYLNQQ